jgi:hypothetical protein
MKIAIGSINDIYETLTKVVSLQFNCKNNPKILCMPI